VMTRLSSVDQFRWGRVTIWTLVALNLNHVGFETLNVAGRHNLAPRRGGSAACGTLIV
jgi:hypothetical protein